MIRPLHQTILTILCAWMLTACSEGGIGGTGGVGAVTGSGDSSPVSLTVSGQANKGPFALATVTFRQIDGGGVVGDVITTSTTDELGGYEAEVEDNTLVYISVRGSYFSENTGVASESDIELRAIVELLEDSPLNINLATHLVSERIRALMEDGNNFASANAMARDELLTALSTVIPAPSNAIELATLALLNATQDTPNEEGNAWLLALSAITERAALDAVEANTLQLLVDGITNDLADNGALDETDNLTNLRLAITRLNPDMILSNLLALDETSRVAAIVARGEVTSDVAATLQCQVVAGEVVCLEAGKEFSANLDVILGSGPNTPDTADVVQVPLTSIVADLNRFIDSDEDGLVNSVDDDDDNDGIPDGTDNTPYGDDAL